MAREFVTAPLVATDEVLAKFARIAERIPDKEPANGGPSHDQFIADLEAVADGIIASTEQDPFPDPEVTAAGYQTKRPA